MHEADVRPALAVLRVPKVVEFDIPASPRSRNSLDQHWTLRDREDARWRALVALYGPHERFEGPVIVTLTFYAPRPCDPDNVARQVLNAMKDRWITVASRKRILEERLIPDDGPKVITELRLRSRKGEPHTTVRIEEVA